MISPDIFLEPSLSEPEKRSFYAPEIINGFIIKSVSVDIMKILYRIMHTLSSNYAPIPPRIVKDAIRAIRISG